MKKTYEKPQAVVVMLEVEGSILAGSVGIDNMEIIPLDGEEDAESGTKLYWSKWDVENDR